MKTFNHYILVILFLLINHIVNAQVTPIETIVTNEKKISYNSNNHTNNKLIVKNQPYGMLAKLRENLKLNSTPNISFISTCLGKNTLSTIKKAKTVFIIEYIINESGEVLSCSLVNYGERIKLSNSQVECILGKAVNNRFSLSNIPSDVSKFYLIAKKRYKFP